MEALEQDGLTISVYSEWIEEDNQKRIYGCCGHYSRGDREYAKSTLGSVD